MNTLPTIDRRYWLTLMLASIFGTNTGDFVADYLHIGHLVGLPWLVGLLAVIVLLDRLVPLRWPLWFWLAVITVRTAATNIGDGFHDFDLGFAVSLPAVSVVLALAVALYAWHNRGRPADGTLRVDAVYWLCMVLAGAWGTIAGDFAAFGLTDPPLFPPFATALTALPLALMFVAGRGGRLMHPLWYWATVALIRTSGTCAGDALAHLLGGEDNVLPATLATGAVFAMAVIGFYAVAPRQRSAPA